MIEDDERGSMKFVSRSTNLRSRRKKVAIETQLQKKNTFAATLNKQALAKRQKTAGPSNLGY
jgi:hypothetical protein